MNKVTGKILLEETGVGIPDLIITVYDVDRNTLGENVLQPQGAFHAQEMVDAWERLQGDRLGSVLTDQHGVFVLEYEDSDLQKNNREGRPDLILYVTAPERSDMGNCGHILHVSYGIRQNAGRLETYLIKLPAELLKKAGISIPGASSLQASDPELDALLSKTRQLLGAYPTRTDTDTKPFSVRYKDRLGKITEERERAGIGERPQLSFDLSIPIRLSGDNDSIAGVEIIPDKQKERFLFKRGSQVDPIPLTFTGVVYARGGPAAKRPSFVVDLMNRSFHISAPSSPMRLELPEGRPSALYNFYLDDRRTSQGAGANTPVETMIAGTSPSFGREPSGSSNDLPKPKA